ncbi:hypothetical protein EJ05DRAFT_318937 [Pseudovirgaria hyperparasitica]|uniref:Uncharacterized protein n=1 Tax=Pseudovirgaria hyperparasitica TaxID=470096 RepID=A0A6A6WFU9_9PEZI|nr:uncharacterized protein EJ05DRAFT_318937 [Pseudovirgaria hyperparasitica]KAF2760011.1 hypothetical protein EJ05DRAFT_318937 [Pseudovirgaria hyperparasitica]
MASSTGSTAAMTRSPQILSSFERLLACPPIHSRPIVMGIISLFRPDSPAKLIRSYLSKTDMLNLRGASKLTSIWVGDDTVHYQWLFRKLYITSAHCNAPRDGMMHALYDISRYCEELVIRINPRARFPSQLFTDDLPERQASDPGSLAREGNMASRASHQGLPGETTLSTVLPPSSGRARSDTLEQLESELRRTSLGGSSGHRPRTSYTSSHRSSGSNIEGGTDSDWFMIFVAIPTIKKITISVDPATVDKGWGKFGHVESTLVAIQEALRRAPLSRFQHLRLAPIHAYGIMHFCWKPTQKKNPGAIVDGELWHKLRTLEVQLINPRPYLTGGISKRRSSSGGSYASDWIVVLKTLHDWLASFSSRLMQLSFHWIGQTGPDPLTLDLLIDKHSYPHNRPTHWARLASLRFGNVVFAPPSLTLYHPRAPRITTLYVLTNDVASADEPALIDFNDPVGFSDYSDELWAEQAVAAEEARSPPASESAAVPAGLGDVEGASEDEVDERQDSSTSTPGIDGIPAEEGWWV